MEIIRIKGVGNYYGGISVQEKNDKYYWIIEGDSTNFNDILQWDEISKELYEELIKHGFSIEEVEEDEDYDE